MSLPSPEETARFNYINFVMNEINNHSDEIYEALADNNITEVRTTLAALKTALSEIEESLKDET